MKIEEYERKLKSARDNFNKVERGLKFLFAKSNSIASIGDVVTDHMHTVVVESVKVSTSTLGGAPSECVYTGVGLKANGEPRKDGKVFVIYQSNVLSVNGDMIK